ncbi:hypothetical protein AB5N19_11374 [Seiridium cardinale]|uniref:SGNH hydrolase-type esterase domain-containing protein n=1 Tax=Seiridium cardinale TaxID=138064 RepID=A0ABR2X9T5_9PEZI
MPKKLLRLFRRNPHVAMIVARRRFLIALGVPLIILCMLMSGFVVDVDTHTKSDVLNGVHVGHSQSNSSAAHSNSTATALTERPKITYTSYERPGYERPLAHGIPLRVLALGASTTRGDSVAEVDNNGFRRPLRHRLTALGHKVNFVGIDRLGNMTDNDIVAGPGVQVDTIHGMAEQIVSKSKPNLILVNAGTNDCLMHVDIDNFYKRYDNLVQYLFMASHKATLVLGTLLPTWDTRFNGREDVFRVNPQIRRLVKIYQKQGLPVVLAEMQGPDGIQDGNLAEDGMHPASAGYEMMATKLYEAILEADARGFLQPAEMVPWIPDDGEEGRKDESDYRNWLKQEKLEADRRAHEESEMAKMEAELEKLRQQRLASG